MAGDALPFPGGPLDQPSALMLAFDVCTGAYEALKPKLREGAGE